MKNLYIMMALVGVAFGFTSCNDDDDPKFQAPTEFVLNTPALASQYYELTPDGTLVFTCSQPNYGFTASTTYGLEIALDKDGETYKVAPLNPTSAQMRVNASDVATAMCVLRGIKTEEQWDDAPAMPVYVRATAQLGSHESSFIESNWIKLDQVKGYYAVPQPGFIYLIGNISGWKEPVEANAAALADYRLFEKDDAIGSQVYYGVFDITGNDNFRFYSKLVAADGWDSGYSFGSQTADGDMEFELDQDGALSMKLVVGGKGNFKFSKFEGGEMTMIVDLKTDKVTFVAGNAL